MFSKDEHLLDELNNAIEDAEESGSEMEVHEQNPQMEQGEKGLGRRQEKP